MKQYAILKDVISNTPYGVAVKSDNLIQFFGLNEQSCDWAEFANQKSLNISQIPDGISVGEFQELTENAAKQFNFQINNNQSLNTKSIVPSKNTNSFVFVESKSLETKSKTPSISDIPLRMFGEAKSLVLAFKIASFKNDVMQSEIALKSRFNQLAFNIENNKFTPRPNSNFKEIEANRLRNKSSAGAQRRFGKKIIEQINSNISFRDIEEKWPGEFISGFLLGRLRRRKKRRKKIGFKTLEILDFHQKGIGRAIGGAIGGAARRTSIPNRGGRGNRGVASRVIAGVLDPSKRRDVDGDGMIFDGTWREMPDPTRFKPDARGLRSRSSRKPDQRPTDGSYGYDPTIDTDAIERRRLLEDSLREFGENAGTDWLNSRNPFEQGRGREMAEQRRNRERWAEIRADYEKPRRGVRSRTSQSPVTSKQKLGELPKNVRFYIQELKDRYPSEPMQALFRELESGFISDINRRTVLDFLDSIENQYQRQDNQSPSVVNRRAISQPERIAAAHLAKIIARTDNDYREERFNPIYGIDYSPVDEIAAPDRSEGRLGAARELASNMATQRRVARDLDRSEGRLGAIRKFVNNNVGLRSQNNQNNTSVIDDLLDQADGANDFIEELLKKAKKDISSLTPDETYNLIEALYDEYANATQGLAGDKRLLGLIKSLDKSLISKLLEKRIEDEFSDVIDDLLDRSQGTSDYLETLLKKFKNGTLGVEDNDWPDFFEGILDEFNNGELQGDKRLGEFIKRLSGVDPSQIKPKPNRGLRSQGGQTRRESSQERGVRLLKGKFDTPQEELEEINKQLERAERAPIGSQSLRLREFNAEQELLKRRKKYLENLIQRGGKYDSGKGPGLKKEEVEDPIESFTRRLREGTLLPSGTPQVRGTRSQTPQNLSSRRALATTERAASPRGLASQSSPKPAGRRRPGVDKVGPSDGVFWQSLNPEQQKKAIDALKKSKKEITSKFKDSIFKSWWADQVRGAKKQSLLGGRFKPRSNDEEFNQGDITEMQRLLDIDTKISPTNRQKVQKQLDTLSLLNKMESTNDYSLLEHLHPAQKGAILKALADDSSFKPVKGFTKTTPSSIFGAGGGLSKEDVNAANLIITDEKKFIKELLDSARGANDATEPLLEKISKNKKLTPQEEQDLLDEFDAQPEVQKKLAAILKSRKKSDKKQVSFRARILRTNPERARRRELRRQRASGQGRRNPIILDPAQQIKRRKLRSAAFRRQILSKFRKSKDAEGLSDSLGERKAELHPVIISQDGKVTVTPEFSNILSLLDERLAEKQSGKSKVYDKLLATLWENFGYSETPVLVTKEEVQGLLDAGWQPVIRGTGNQAVESESYVEQFLTNPGRFIPGQGARAYGVGEYFAFPGGNWTGYSGGAEDRHSMLVLIPPTAKIMTSRELNSERQDMANLSTLIHNEFVAAGGRDVTEAMTAGELAQMARKGAPQLAESKTISGQILNQLINRLEELDNMPGDTKAEKVRILQSLDYLQRFSKNEEVGQFAPIIGVDAIDTNDDGSSAAPLLLHNRSIVAAFQAPMTRKDAEDMSGGVIKTWDKWKSKTNVSKAPDVEPKKSFRKKPRTVRQQTQNPNAPVSQLQAALTPKSIPNAVDTSSWTSSKPPFTPGSNPAELLTAPDGTQYYAKKPKPNEPIQKATERMETEVLASKLYKLAGIETPELSLGDRSGEPRMLSQIMQTRMPNSTSDQDAARAGFVVDAWLANWDAPLNDNIKFDSNNNPIRMDVGGSLDYRAQGGKKETTSTPFGDTVGEITSMQKSGNINFTNMSPQEIKKQAQALSTITDDKIRATVSAIVSDPQRAAKLAQTLINRRDDIVARYG